MPIFALQNKKMSRQIKMIWIFSLVSVLLLIGMQGYWLINQYKYVLNSYSEEIASQVVLASEEELLNRSDEKSSPLYFVVDPSRDRIKASREGRILSILPLSSIPDVRIVTDSLNDTKSQIQIKFNGNSLPHLEIDNAIMYTTYYTHLTGDELINALQKSIINRKTPFSQALFDSILVSILPIPVYSIVPWQKNDTYDNFVLWKRTGNLFDPRLTVSYAYNPLDNEGVYIHFKLPVQPVLYKMGVQLPVSFSITFLLIISIVFQMRMIVKQKKVNEIRENFVNTMVHELKRPVQTLKTFVSFLNNKKMQSDTEATQQVLHDSMFELDNLSAYLNKLKDMLRVDSEQTSLCPVTFNLPDLVEKVVRLTHIPLDKDVSISTVYETENIQLEADPIHFANVLSNLIENAIKYSGDNVTIEIQVKRDKQKIYVAVKDNGIGIPIAEQDKVFTKFYRGNNISDKSIPGIGLGLSYAKLIIEAHQGTVMLNSRTGAGTVVTICLPQ